MKTLNDNSDGGELNSKHSAVLCRNGKFEVQSIRHNTDRSRIYNPIFGSRNCHSCHAEIEVTNHMVSNLVKKKNIKNKVVLNRNMRKCKIFVNRKNNERSEPCKHCVDTLIQFGINKICYMGENGSIHEEKLRNIQKTITHISKGNRN